MRFHRSHPVIDGLMVGVLTLTSFGIFYLVSAQTGLIAEPLPPIAPTADTADAPLAPPAPLPPPPPPSADGAPVIAPVTARPGTSPAALSGEDEGIAPSCRETGITDHDVCEKFLKEGLVVTPEEAELREIPDLCELKGVTTPGGCKKMMAAMLSTAKPSRPAGRGASAGPATASGRPVGIEAMLPKPCTEQGITEADACEAFMEHDFPAGSGAAPERAAGRQYLPKECGDAGISDPAKCQEHFAARAVLPRCKERGATTPDECRALIVADNLPAICKDSGIYGEKGCQAFVAESFMPKSCKEAGISDPDACRASLLERNGRPTECAGLEASECWKLIEAGKIGEGETARLRAATLGDMSDTCARLGAKDLADCEHMAQGSYVPPECRQAGIFMSEACDRHLFEKYGKASDADLQKAMPADCAAAAIAVPADCRRMMERRHFPEECVEQGIADAAACGEYLRARHETSECRDAGAATDEDCEAVMRKKYMSPICTAQGIGDPAACEEFVYGNLSGDIVCEGLDSEQCAMAAKGRHLGEILGAYRRNGETGKVMDQAGGADGDIDLDALAVRGDDLHRRVLEVLPFSDTRMRLRTLRSVTGVAVTGNDTVDAAAPFVLTFDSDSDGIPDDIETRFGTDPAKPDTDGNGVGDMAELKNRHAAAFAPVDLAIVGGGTVGQPTTQGSVDSSLSAAFAEDGTLRAGTGRSIGLRGTAPAGTKVVSLYVYSDVPVLVTTAVDANGQWTYTFDNQLKDGAHEVYVAINDNTGKVVKKSDPLSFMVSTARAASPADAAAQAKTDSQANAASGGAQQNDIRLFAAGGAVLLAVAVVIAVLLFRPKKPKDAGDGAAPPPAS